jgi:hypothetical protein
VKERHMKGRIGVLCAASMLAATSAQAQENPETAPAAATEAPRESRMQQLGDIDIRGTFNADILLAFVNLGAAVDVGVLPLGPGVLAVGGEMEFGTCLTFCAALSLATGWNYSNVFYSPHARATYHFTPGSSSSLSKVDVYGLAFAGITYTTTRVTNGSNSGFTFDYSGSDVGPSVGAGIGAKYFLQERFFAGAEARLRWAAGTYTYTVKSGDVTITDSQSGWSMSGLNVQLFAGIRI